MPGTAIRVGLTNHVMGAMKNHPYFQLLVNSLKVYDYNWVLPYMTIMNSAGPHFVSMVWEDYIKMTPRQADVRILMQEEYAGNEWSFFTKEKGGTWNYWDTRMFKWAGDHIILVSVTCFLCICGLAAFIWWSVWVVAVRPGTKDMKGYSSSLPLWQKSD
jgi:inositol phosphorylceramide mannosyltransferase catalytic subunit